MTALTFLHLQNAITQTKLTETLDPLLDSAIYSYTARSSSPYFSLRTTLISLELLTLRGGSAPDDAVKWASRALSAGTLGDIGSCLLVERIAGCYKISQPRRRRKMALWSMLACEAWSGVGCRGCAVRCLRDAWGVYKGCDGFGRIGGHMAGLMENLGVKREGGEEDKVGEVVDMQELDEGGGLTGTTDGQGITVEFA
jgi:ER-Golgi trafficking TRAPP I complex 85 kDa subunit